MIRLAVALAAFVVWAHRGNVRRLLRGEECFVWRLPPAPLPDEKENAGRFDRGNAGPHGEDSALGELVVPTGSPHGNPPDQPTNPAVLQSFVRRALQTERTVVYSEEPDEGTTPGTELAAIRSAISAGESTSTHEAASRIVNSPLSAIQSFCRGS